jgi:3-oxoacyl-[acyl-carrier protein] reductase
MNRVIIGGSSGIGSSVVDNLIHNKDDTIINLSRRINKFANHNIYCDVTDYKSVKSSFNEIYRLYGKIDTLVYSAGFVEPQSLLDIDEEVWNKTINTNLNGAFYCTKEFVKIANSNSKIIYIASTAGIRPQPQWSAYACSKAGLINFGLTMSEELKDYKIKTYILSCGRCATPLRKKLAPSENQSEIMQPEDVANIIKNILDDGKLIDGQNIIVRKCDND